MARPLRIRFQGTWYHVMNRGAARREVFPSREDVTDFVKLLGEIVEGFPVEIHGYCVMGGHYHVLLRTPEAILDCAMRHLDGVYTRGFHQRHGTDGSLFREPHRAVIVKAGRHLVQVSRYIHLNPVEAGLAARAEDWPYSSLRGYLDPTRGPRWLRTSAVLRPHQIARLGISRAFQVSNIFHRLSVLENVRLGCRRCEAARLLISSTRPTEWALSAQRKY